MCHGGIADSFITDRKEGNVFRSVCQSFCSQGQGGLPSGQRPFHGQAPPPGQIIPGQIPVLDREPPEATAAVGTHPIGMHSCFQFTTHSTKNNITAIITVMIILSTVADSETRWGEQKR